RGSRSRASARRSGSVPSGSTTGVPCGSLESLRARGVLPELAVACGELGRDALRVDAVFAGRDRILDRANAFRVDVGEVADLLLETLQQQRRRRELDLVG